MPAPSFPQATMASSAENFPLAKGTRMPPPLDCLGCANNDLHKQFFCPNDATKFCSGCRLVGYCSKECQKAHWKKHKEDCTNPMLSNNWEPAWVVEQRSPDFMHQDNQTSRQTHTMHGLNWGNMYSWGNMPAYDILNLRNNEGYDSSRQKDLSIAFVASGDLRNFVRTVNELPEDYTGSLNVLLNDRNPWICCRNLLILLILGGMSDVNEGAEHALHVWYSVFLPASFIPRVLATIIHKAILEIVDRPSQYKLTQSTSLCTEFDDLTKCCLVDRIPSHIELADAENALQEIMNAPSRVDYIDRYYVGLRPSHRVAFQQWRKFGLVLPFGASNAHMNIPNKWLFGPNGQLFICDGTSPCEGWDISAVLEAGARYGTTQEDHTGCLFFYVKEQLVEFSKRLRRFNITISLWDKDVRDLPSRLGPSVKYDRIEVSNITDKEYVGITRVLSDWGTLLDPTNQHAAIIGLFMNWVRHKPESMPSTAYPEVMSRAVKKCGNWFMKKRSPMNNQKPKGNPSRIVTQMYLSLNAFHETSRPFYQYLKDEAEGSVTQKAELKHRKVNKIVAHRPYARLGTSWDSLPDIQNDEDFYRYALLSMVSNCERYVEWTRKQASE